MLSYTQGDVLEAHPAVVAHACNCLGYWSGGIALAIKRKYPQVYRMYSRYCEENTAETLLGSTQVFVDPESGTQIVCLFTSICGQESAAEITQNTHLALQKLQDFWTAERAICMPKINSGIFGVPWELTEQLLINSPLQFIVYEL